jgi:hypothetical protein
MPESRLREPEVVVHGLAGGGQLVRRKLHDGDYGLVEPAPFV